ncbi:MAG: hypothetical protein WC321_00515 [Candidatus Omnitrophota bacterium]|jgi:hypothetical protein
MKKKYILMLLGLIITFTLGLVFFSFYQTPKIEQEIAKLNPLPKIDTRVKADAAKPLRKLTPSNPEEYGIIVIPEGSQPQTQAEWDSFIQENTQRLKTKGTLYSKSMSEEERMDATEALERMEADIRQQEEALRKDPENQGLKEKLQRLMMLRSITKASLQE